MPQIDRPPAMNVQVPLPSAAPLREPRPEQQGYGIRIEPLEGRVTLRRGDVTLADSTRAKVMYETRLPPTIYFPAEDVAVHLSDPTDLQTFCPFKGTASYRDLLLEGEQISNGVWSYDKPLTESLGIKGYVGFMPSPDTKLDLGRNRLDNTPDKPVSGPLIDWLFREAAQITTPEDLTRALGEKLLEHGVAVSRLSVMIWSLHPMIVGRNITWSKGHDEVTTFAPSYELHDHPSYVNSPLRHVSNGLGGVRQRLDVANFRASFPIMEDLRKQGATDYVAMPLPFSDGRTNVLTLTSDHPGGFTTANLGLVFECVAVISRFYEVFTQRQTAQSLLETYVGKRTGARVLGGEIRRGEGDEINAAIMFCDLRGSTLLEERLERRDYIAMLNDYFETVSSIVHDHGGEVLKFIGDAVLAVFPADADAEAARMQAVHSAVEITERMAEIRDQQGRPVDCAIGLSYGAVTYGNVGSRERLDFTVIGQAANIAARLGDYGKASGYRIVVSEDIMPCCDSWTDLGDVTLHNVSRPVRCFGISAGS